MVWRARDASSGRLVALKTALASPDASEALAREAAMLARTERRWGPALVDAGAGYLVSEWVEGEPLDPRAVRGDREKLGVVVAHALARALEELHEARVRHGDVKPSNVLLVPGAHGGGVLDTASDRGATLVDFGLAGSIDEAPR